ncbi:NAD(P)-dependent oxidoreductase [Candidatus Woesearchaeota archaeon]|nr:NAD(P)-dependent oxidoreductase [Candidatus Woesearchaeota archaeon]
MAKKKILVTGAPGWLGNRLVEKLCSDGYQVRCLSLEGTDASHLKKMGAEVMFGNVLKPETLDRATKDIEVVVHSCGLIHPTMFGIKSLYDVNGKGTRNMLKSSSDNKVKKFVYISSNSAMGINRRRDRLFKESDKPRPYTPYGHSKRKGELAVEKYQELGKIQTVILRPCWFYGPEQPERQTTLMKMIQSGKPLMFGDGNNLRSMTYIDNLVQGVMLAIEKEKANGQKYWIADEKPYTTNEIYETIAKHLGVTIKPRKLPKIVPAMMEIADLIFAKLGIYVIQIHVGGEMVRDIACSVEKAKRELGYDPKFSLDQGMKISIEWTKKQGYLD